MPDSPRATLLRRVAVRRVAALTAAAVTLLPACTIPVQRNDWSTYTGPGAAHFQKEEYTLPFQDDPVEPLNRLILQANHVLLAYVVNPFAVAWRYVVPQEARNCLGHAANNLGYPGRAVNNLLQGRLDGARNETDRFLINSTVGILGLFDRASERGIPRAPTDTGTTLNVWGWNDSTFIGLPLLGPSTVRDTVGLVGDRFLDPTTYFFPAGPITAFIVGSERLDDYLRLAETNFDAYEPVRLFWMAGRQIPSTHFDVTTKAQPGSTPGGIAAEFANLERVAGTVESVRAATVSFQDPWFPFGVIAHAADIPSTGKRLTYELWLQPKPAPIVFILPGLGTNRRAKMPLAMAELMYNGGFSAVTISSAMSFDFMRSAATVPVPGYTPADARDVHGALTAISADIDRRHPGRVQTRALLGTSLGAAHALFIAAAESQGTPGVVFDRYVAINAPVSARHAIDRVDQFFNAPLELPPDQRDNWVVATLQKALRRGIAGGASARKMGFTLREAEFLVGLSFRFQLRDVIWVSQQRHDIGVLKTRRDRWQRGPASQEILEFSYTEYFYAFVLPWFLEHEPSVTSDEEMFRNADLRSIEDDLQANDKVTIVTNENDFLMRPEDLEWIKSLYPPQRVRLFPGGGHLGNLHEPAVREAILLSLKGLHQKP